MKKFLKIKAEIELLLKIDFEYYEKAFGDIVLKIKYHDKELAFSTDRGDIYYNSDLVCNHEYMKSERKIILQKLKGIIEGKLVLLKK